MRPDMVSVNRKPRLEGSSILHRCDPAGDGEMCFCMYDAECTGRYASRMVKLPLWLDVALRPRHAWRVFDARRRLTKAGKYRNDLI